MTSPTDPAPVRLLSGLTADELSDNDIFALLDVNGGAVKLAAADALEVAAGKLTSVTSDDISLDESKRAAVLMARATRLRDQHAASEAEDGFFFDVIDSGAAHPELTERSSW